MIKKVLNSKNSQKDNKKERIFRLLADCLSETGIRVRREQLKRGHGWRASSGSCVLKQSGLVVIDSALSQEDQIEFLLNAFKEFNIKASNEFLGGLPESYKNVLSASFVPLVQEEQVA